MKNYLSLLLIAIGVYLAMLTVETTQAQESSFIPNASFSENVLTIVAMSDGVYIGTATGKVYKSTNHGETWANISQGLPGNVPVLKLVTDKISEDIYLMLSNQVYKLDKTSRTWLSINSGLPNNVTFTAMTFGSTSRESILYLATNGAGVYTRDQNSIAWSAYNTGLTQTDIVALLPGFAQASTGELYRDSNFDGWVKMKADLPSKERLRSGFFLPGKSSNDAYILYLVSATNIYQSIPTSNYEYGTSWTRVDFTIPPNTHLNTAILDNYNNVYLGLDSGQLYRKWQLANTQWSNSQAIQAMIIDSYSTLYLATAQGVLQYPANSIGFTVTHTTTGSIHIPDWLRTEVYIPPDVVTEATELRYYSTNFIRQPAPAKMAFAGRSINLEAYNLKGVQQNGFTFKTPVEITMPYDTSKTMIFPLSSLQVYAYDGTTWSTEGITIKEKSASEIVFSTRRASEFALLGDEPKHVYMPGLLNGYPAIPFITGVILSRDGNFQCSGGQTPVTAQISYKDPDKNVGVDFKTVIHTEWLYFPSLQTTSKDINEYEHDRFVNSDINYIKAHTCIPLDNQKQVYLTVWLNDGVGNISNRSKATLYSPTPPVISSIHYQLDTLNNAKACSFMTPVGSSFQIRFDYHDNDGTVSSNGSVLYTTAKFSPSGNIHYAEVPIYRTTQTGDTFNGTIIYYPCLRYDNDTSATITLSLVDATDRESNQLSVTIPRPINANSVNESSSQYGVSPN